MAQFFTPDYGYVILTGAASSNPSHEVDLWCAWTHGLTDDLSCSLRRLVEGDPGWTGEEEVQRQVPKDVQ